MTSSDETFRMHKLNGKCLCGTVCYEVEDKFLYSLNCHCSNCRRATGSAFKPFAGIERAKLRITAGADRLLIFGNESPHDAHCGKCGSLLYSLVRPGAHIFVGSKAPWYAITDDLPQHEEFA
jgi:hypothetical protein